MVSYPCPAPAVVRLLRPVGFSQKDTAGPEAGHDAAMDPQGRRQGKDDGDDAIPSVLHELLDMVDLCANLKVKRPTAQKFIKLLEATHLINRLLPLVYSKRCYAPATRFAWPTWPSPRCLAQGQGDQNGGVLSKSSAPPLQGCGKARRLACSSRRAAAVP